MSPSGLVDLLHRVRSSASFERLRPASLSRQSLDLKQDSASSSSSALSEVAPVPAILRDANVTSTILDYLVDVPGGKRMVSKLARTCKSFFEPATDALWKELDSLVPLIGLFPAHLLRRAKRPGLGLAKIPEDEDWDKLLSYGERVCKLTYNESFYNISPAVFPIIDEHRPRLYILPNLHTLVWRCETPAGLDRSLLFLNPQLEHLTLDIGMRIPNLDSFVDELPKRAKLNTLAITSVTPLPDNFTEAMKDQCNIEKLSLNLPGSLSPNVGKWTASLPKLHTLQLDLTARSISSIEAFFEETGLRSGYSTPSSVGGTDSGVFSGGEDFDLADFRKDLRKSALRVTGDYPAVLPIRTNGAFPLLREVNLTGDAGSVAAFLKHLRSEVVTLELTIEDPPEALDWQDLCTVLHERFSGSLQSLRIAATNSSRPELVRTMSRGEAHASAKPLSLQHFPSLPQLSKLDIDLAQSVIFNDEDAARLAAACPALKVLKLCPTARFPIPSGPPLLTLEGLAHLTRGCSQLHTLAVVVNARPGTDQVLGSRDYSSHSLLRLNVGHSWARDPLQTAVLLSHLAPRLHQLKFFHESNRTGYVAAHANAWQQTAIFLPHLQRLRAAERRASQEVLDRVVRQLTQRRPERVPEPVYAPKLESIAEGGPGAEAEYEDPAEDEPSLVLPEKIDRAVDATPTVTNIGIATERLMAEVAVSASPIEDEDPMPSQAASPTSVVSGAAFGSVEAAAEVSPVLEMPEASHILDQEVSVSPDFAPEWDTKRSDVVPLPSSPSYHTASANSRSPTLSVSSTTSIPHSTGLLSRAREAVLTLPLYLSLVAINASLAMLGARHTQTMECMAERPFSTASSTTTSPRPPIETIISPVCI